MAPIDCIYINPYKIYSINKQWIFINLGITDAIVRKGTVSDFATFVDGLALLTIVLTIVDSTIVILVLKHELAKKLIYKYMLIIFAVLYIIVIALTFAVNIELGSQISYLLIIPSRIAFIVSLFLLLNKAKNCVNYNGNICVQLKLIIFCQFINFIVVVVMVLIGATSSSWVLLLSGIFNYLCLTMFVESGIVSVMQFVYNDKFGDNKDSNKNKKIISF